MRKTNLYEIAENGGGVELSPFDIKVFHGASNVLRNTDEGAFITSEIFSANGWDETPELREKVTESLRKIDAAGLLNIPEFHKGEYDEVPYDDMPTPWDGQRGTTWHGLNADAMAAILDELWGAGTFDNERWDEWFKMYGSPYRVMPSKYETEKAIHWQVTAIPDDSAERITMAQFHVKSDAQAYAKTLGEDWEPMVTGIDSFKCLCSLKHPANTAKRDFSLSDGWF